MKRVISILILVVALIFISGITVYTLSKKGVRKEVTTKIIKKVSKVTSNISNNSVADVYNVYLNDSRYKVKLEYNVTIENKKAKINLIIFINGKEIFNDILSDGVSATDIDSLFKNENINKYVRLSERDIQIIRDNKQEFMTINIGYYTNDALKKYFIFTEKGIDITNGGIVSFDSSRNYISTDGKDLDIFYDSMSIAKIDKNVIYALEYVSDEDVEKFLEYKYTIKNAKLNKELVNTYSDIKLVQRNNSKK